MKYSKRATIALKQSIEHWQRLEACITMKAFDREGIRSGSCPLCDLYLKPHGICSDRCPIKITTERNGCHGTPWIIVSTASRIAGTNVSEFLNKAVTTMRIYLEDLL